MYIDICKIYLVIYTLLLLSISTFRIRCNKYLFYTAGIFFAWSVCSIAVLYIPSITDDAYRYECIINQMQGSRFTDSFYASMYKTEFVFSTLLYIVANFFPSTSYLRLIICSATFLVLFRLVYLEGKEKIVRTAMYYLTIESTVLLYFFASGLRSFAASVIFIYAVYMKQKNKIVQFFIFIMLAIGMHNVIIIPTIILFLTEFFNVNIVFKLLLITWGMFAQFISNMLLKSGNQFMYYLGHKMDKYLNDIQVNIDSRFFVLQFIILLILTILLYRYMDSKTKNKHAFIECLILFNYGCIFNYTFFERILRINVFVSLYIFFNLKRIPPLFSIINMLLASSASIMLVYQIINVSSNMIFK